jgi:Arc/MetJ-type ribon-helix-helix transcriptional regulator
MLGVKLSISIPADDVEFLDAYAADRELPSRSAAVHHAIRALRTAALPHAYADAWADFEDDAAPWDATAGDGLP